jgi:long-chain fatty acid transport protein
MRKLIALMLLAPAVALANGYSLPNVNPRDLALADSAVAAQGDAAATFKNPSALSKVEGLQLSIGGSVLFLDQTWTATTSDLRPQSPESLQFKPAPPVAIFAAYGREVFGMKSGVGVGLNLLGGANVFWDGDWAGRGRIIEVDRKVYGSFLTAGVQVLPQLRVGGGLMYAYTTEYLKQGVQPFPDGYAEIAAKGGGFSYDVSAELTPIAGYPLTFGLDYKHKTRMELKGDAHFNIPEGAVPTDPATVDQGATHVLTYPNTLNVGVAWRPVPPVQVTFGFTLDRYVVYKDDTFTGDRGFVVSVPRNYGNGHTFRLGAEWNTTARLTLRGGILRDVSGLKTDTYSPSLPDASTWAFAGGADWRFSDTLSVAASIFWAPFDVVTSTGPEAFPGKFDANVILPAVGVVWRPL